jgi:hypothetical protein
MGPGGWLVFVLYRWGHVRDGSVALAMDALPVSNFGSAVSYSWSYCSRQEHAFSTGMLTVTLGMVPLRAHPICLM